MGLPSPENEWGAATAAPPLAAPFGGAAHEGSGGTRGGAVLEAHGTAQPQGHAHAREPCHPPARAKYTPSHCVQGHPTPDYTLSSSADMAARVELPPLSPHTVTHVGQQLECGDAHLVLSPPRVEEGAGEVAALGPSAAAGGGARGL
ncbi:hypothetical protein DUNSADRAFT_1138 [Dunaliella salina]|uniref:Encoded protein n=1 Tax=Dunaliella salina TaxID=3046 RepID=A0ABQ7FXX3_DUNSA|nr:hypothetical protein DUNSADRAFT_1138 [Dunaliella salina]|eukprot:KAF5827200.1 hypothetical protein DUNSADRAFT_1138 [Dunaliella salina]